MLLKTRPDKNIALVRGLVLGVMAALIVWIMLSSVGGNNTQNPQSQPVADVSAPNQGVQNVAVPPAQVTGVPTVPGITPTRIIVPTPTVRVWPTPVPIQNVTTSVMSTTAEMGLGQMSTIDRTESISQLIWAPTGDKLLYLTMSGDLYWSNPDGSSATLLRHYGEVRLQLEEQNPMTNTLLLLDLGQPLPDGGRAPSHLDVVRFTPGQPPTLQDGPDLPHPFVHLRWWSPTRASGIAHAGEDGADLLVTVDQNGNLVNEINVPYMINGDVQPGDEWLAYTTTYQVDNPVDGTMPLTGYLLNLNTGQRLQVTQPGGGSVGNWSPDGNWFLSSNSVLGLALVSADGHQWVRIPDLYAGIDAVWSPDSKYLAYTVIQDGPSSNEFMVGPCTSSVHVVNVPAREVTNLAPGSNKPVSVAGEGSTLLMQPKWSRDSKTVTFLSGGCSIYDGSQLTPAIISMAVK